MSVSSTSSSTSNNTSSIDVASIVSQLMTAENKPLDAIKSKISEQQVIISDLGAVRAKVSTFKDALRTFEDPNSYNNAVASTSDSGVVTAMAANGAIAGSYKINIEQLAQSSKYGISGFSSGSTLVSLDSTSGFEITIGTTKYSTKGVITVDGLVSLNKVPVLKSSPTVADLQSWINSLGVAAKANVVQTTSSNQWTLTIEGTALGLDNAVSYTGLLTGTPNPDATVVAQNAKFTLNGIEFDRPTNTISDAVNKLTFSLLGTTSVGVTKTVMVSAGADNSEKIIQDLVILSIQIF